MAQTKISTRIQNKHELEANWLKSSFVPMQGELIIYDIEVDKNGNALDLTSTRRTTPYIYERFKIGDGISTVTDLPFTVNPHDHDDRYYTETEIDTKLTTVTDALADEVTARADADSALADDISDALDEAKGYADDIKGELAGDLGEAVNAINASIEKITEDVEDHEDRLGKVEAFFNAADHDGEEGGLNDALDTLVEIQAFLDGEGGAVKEIIDDIAANAEAIEDLQGEFAEGGRVTVVEGKASANEAAIEAIDDRVNVLESISKSYLTGGEDAIKNAVDAAAALGQTGIDNAAAAHTAAEAADAKAQTAQDEVDALELVVDGVNNAIAGNLVPERSTDDNGKFLRIVNGVPAWATVPRAEESSF